MKVTLEYEYEPEELQSQLQYQLIASSMGSDRWETLSNKHKIDLDFTEHDKIVIGIIGKKCSKWYLKEFPKEPIVMYQKEFEVWQRLIKFCQDNFTVYGSKN